MTERRREIAEELLAEHKTEWDEVTVERLLAVPYVAQIASDNESWLVPMANLDALPGIIVGTFNADYAEWVESVYDLFTGDEIKFKHSTRVEVKVADALYSYDTNDHVPPDHRTR